MEMSGANRPQLKYEKPNHVIKYDSRQLTTCLKFTMKLLMDSCPETLWVYSTERICIHQNPNYLSFHLNGTFERTIKRHWWFPFHFIIKLKVIFFHSSDGLQWTDNSSCLNWICYAWKLTKWHINLILHRYLRTVFFFLLFFIYLWISI